MFLVTNKKMGLCLYIFTSLCKTLIDEMLQKVAKQSMRQEEVNKKNQYVWIPRQEKTVIRVA